ncbi:MAG: ABC transporter permease [Thaumarchaeota archaeon]|nr:ABC transporter permease [Nitrososphaerota archaeon]
MGGKEPSALANYVVRRLLEGIPVVFAVLVLNFLLIALYPGDPAQILAGQEATPQYLQQIRIIYGLDRPIYERFFDYLWAIFHGNLGYSFFFQEPVTSLILQKLPATLMLLGTAMVIASLIGILMGVEAARKPHSLRDGVVSAVSLLGYSTPNFWLGQLAILLFSVNLRWLPVAGMTTLTQQLGGLAYVADVLRHLVLPASVLGVYQVALIAHLQRGSMLEVLRQNFILALRSKGLSERSIVYKHALRNAILPVLTVIAFDISALLGGAVLVETVFDWPGIGRMVFDAIIAGDYPVITGTFVVVSIGVVMVNLVTDVIYALVDPRIHYR